MASGRVSLTTFDGWLGVPPGPAFTHDSVALRYLAAFGPATAADMRAWSGLAWRETFERLRPRLAVFHDVDGRELFDLPKAPRPDPATEVPVRFLPDYDNILLGHEDRTRIMAPGQHVGLFSSAGIMKGSLLVDGFVRGGWIPSTVGGTTTLIVTPFERPIPKADRAGVAEEGSSLLEFLAPGARHDVRFAPVRR